MLLFLTFFFSFTYRLNFSTKDFLIKIHQKYRFVFDDNLIIWGKKIYFVRFQPLSCSYRTILHVLRT